MANAKLHDGQPARPGAEPADMDAPGGGPDASADHPGARLRAAREAQGSDLKHIAAETRVPIRHLKSIEAGDFAALPGRTYATGFSRSYAKVVGLDEDAIADAVRDDLGRRQTARPRPQTFEPGDPARVPGRATGWIMAVAIVVVLGLSFLFFRQMLRPGVNLPPTTEAAPAQGAAGRRAAPAATPAPVPAGPVVFTALADAVWVKFYDASGTTLLEKELSRGESYTVPPGTEGPQLWTGRPDALAITVGGRPLPKLAQDVQIIRDVPVTGEALLARASGGSGGGAPAAVPAAGGAGETP